MTRMSRRAFVADVAMFGTALVLGGCASTPEGGDMASSAVAPDAAGMSSYALMYGPVPDERFAVPAVDLSKIDPAFLRREVPYRGSEAPGTVVISPAERYLYHVQPGGRAVRYGVGVGKEGFEWSGVATINSKQEWPDWYPPAEMIERRPDIKEQLVELRSGMGVPGGLRNPIGARGLYLWQNNEDTLFRIHGTNEPHTIGKSVSSGCIRMINQDVMHLYERVPIGSEVKVLPVAVG